jgi:hypothetical protein
VVTNTLGLERSQGSEPSFANDVSRIHAAGGSQG